MNDSEKIKMLRAALGTCSVLPRSIYQPSQCYWFDEDAVKSALAATVPYHAGQADSDGWITWEGGRRPTDAGKIEVVLRGGSRWTTPRVKYLNWEHTGDNGDIVKYRVVK
jgi:hypothetical protein